LASHGGLGETTAVAFPADVRHAIARSFAGALSVVIGIASYAKAFF
jgi:hypothetical protein